VIIELAAGGAGLLAVVTSLAWRGRARRAANRQLRLALLDPDPATRRAAVFLASERGLAPYADLLIERTQVEHDQAVLQALADSVARNQWEPADDRRLVDLRVWAQRQLATGTTTTTTEAATPTAAPDTNGSRGASAARESSPGKAPEALAGVREAIDVLEPATATVGGPSTPVASPPPPSPPPPAPASSTGPRPTARPSPAPRSARGRRRPATVLVTGAGGPAGVAVIRALTASGHPAVAADSDSLAVGLRLGTGSGVLPRADDDTFVERLCRLATEWGASAVVPTVAEELVALAEASDELLGAGVAHWLPSPAAVQACTDKWRFAQMLEDHDIPAPATNLGSAEGVPGAWIVKPRFGRGSRDVVAVDRPDELAWALAKVPQPIVQTRLSGREFTVDALVDRDGTLAGAVPRWRLETKAGISTKGRTFEDDSLCAGVGRLLAAVGLHGPANVQGFVGDDGAAAFTEVNPRFSGGLPLSVAAGADLVGEYLRGILGQPVRKERLTFRPGVTMLRHFEEVFE